MPLYEDNVAVAGDTMTGKLAIISSGNDHSIEVIPTGDAGSLSASGGAIFINNTGNIGNGLGIYSNADGTATGNLINVKADNAAFDQAAIYVDYDGVSNAVEITSNSTDSSSNALSVTGNNPNDSTVGFMGTESGRGTLKITHTKPGVSDANASGISIDLQGSGTAAQGIYVDSTVSGGTTGNLLRLRNQTVDRFVVNSLGSVSIGGNGTNTTITKTGNTAGDEFFVGTTGSFRVQRSAGGSEAFRVQINGDTQGRWLGTSSGVLSWGPGNATQDTNLYRSAQDTLKTDDKFIAAAGLNMGAAGVGVPASASATGTTGDIAFDSSFLYACTATNTWKRVAIASW